MFIIIYIGNVYVADQFNNRVRKITASTGIITTIAGTGTASYSGDGGAATSAALNKPSEISLDASGSNRLIVVYFISFGLTSSMQATCTSLINGIVASGR